MAVMIDERPIKYQGEGEVWDCLSKLANNLPPEPPDIIGYNHREVNGREFDFCLLIRNIGLVIIEVKGWNLQHIKEVAGIDKIILTNNTIECSPKKQARSYRFALLNILSDKYSVSPLIFDLVCYPFLSKDDYKKIGLDSVSESEFTLFKEDINNVTALGKKINSAFNKMKTIPHTKMDNNLFNKIRQHFEPSERKLEEIIVESSVRPIKPAETIIDTPYSKLLIYSKKIEDEQIEEVIENYFKGTKHFIFVSEQEDVVRVENVLKKCLHKKNIRIDKGNLVLDSIGTAISTIENKDCFRAFNFEIYYRPEDVSNGHDLSIIEGKIDEVAIDVLTTISTKTLFNCNQYFIEHADCRKNTLVKAGAGTGKTFSMVSRIAFLCNKSQETVVNLVDEIAMVTFTNDASDNMKVRLKQMFINYFVLTKNPKHLRFIEEVEQMQISTIHKFAKNIIQSVSLSLGLGHEFAIASSDFVKEQSYEKFLDAYVEKKTAVEPFFFKELKIPIYRFKKILMNFSNQLYNKSIDIKDISVGNLGKPIPSIPFFNEIIEEVIIAAENEYSDKIIGLNKLDLKECMIILNQVVNDIYREKCDLKYKYLFIDEFQDTDDTQIDSFLKLQDIVGYQLFVVGDLKQSIYRFRGANEGAFDKLDFSGDKWEDYTLNTNYRTDYRLLKKFDVMFTNMGKEGKLPFKQGIDSLTSQIDTEIDKNELIQCVEYHSKQEEMLYNVLFAEVERQTEIIKGLEKKKILSKEEKTIIILVRENWQIDLIVKEAKLRKMRIETKVGGDLYKLSPVIDLYKLVLALNNSREPLYLYNLIDSNNLDIHIDVQSLFGKSKEDKRKILVNVLDKYYSVRMGKTWDELIKDMHNKPVLMVLKKIYDTCQPWKKYSDDIGEQRFYRANYELVLEKIIKSYSVDYLTINRICNSLRINIITKQTKLARTLDREDGQCKVICTTIHKAKGLEYGTVIMPYTNQRIDSFKKAELDVVYHDNKLGYALKIGENKEQNSNYDRTEEITQRVNEESRVLYVALTRTIRNFIWFKDLDQTSGLSLKDLLEEN